MMRVGKRQAIGVQQLVFEPGVDHAGMQRLHARTSVAALARGRADEAEWRMRAAAAHLQQWRLLCARIEAPILERVARERSEAAHAAVRGEEPSAAPSLGADAAAVDAAFKALSREVATRGFAEAVIVGRSCGLVFLRYDGDKLMSVVEHKGRQEIRTRCTWRPASALLMRGYLAAIARGAVLIEFYDRAKGGFTEAHRATGQLIPLSRPVG